MNECKVSIKKIKRCFSANGSLFPLVLKWRFVHIIACSLFVALVLPCLGGRSASAASITLTVPSRLTLSAVADGNFHESAAATVSVKSDAYSGYTLGVKSGESSRPALKNGSNTIPSISSAMAGSAFPVNTWGWLPSKLGGQANAQYQPGPTSTLVTIEKTASPNASAANSYTIKLGAKVNGTFPAGTYVNTFTFTATANPVPYTITYQGESAPGKQTGSGMEGTQITLAGAPTRENYEFKGWCSVETTNDKCDGKDTPTYEAGGKYTLTNSANNVTLWAMWKQNGISFSITYNLTGGSGGPSPNPRTGTTTGTAITLDSKTPIGKCGYAFQYWCSANNTSNPTTCSGSKYNAGGSYPLSNGTTPTLYAVWGTTGTDLGYLGNMQSFSCSSKIPSIGGFGTVTDTRDNNTYCVRKLKDNKCWMVDNLRLGDSKLTNRTLTSANTDLRLISSYELPESNKDGFATSETDDYTLQNIYVVEADSGSVNFGEKKIYGGYYTWNAAVAGTGSTSITSSGIDAFSSICPKGWRLPTGNTGGEFEKLNNAYGGITDNDAHLINPDGPNFLLGGEFDGDWSSHGGDGKYWSSTSYHRNGAYYLSVISTQINPNIFFNRTYGISVRCVARDSDPTVPEPTMQTVDQWGDMVPEGPVITAVDERDGNTYRVRRLADGKLWMIDNLRLGDSKLKNRTLTSSNTDLNGISTYTLPNSSKSGFSMSSGSKAENIYVVEADDGAELKAYGGYYTFNAATAGTGASVTSVGANASSSICPKGWRLPTNNSTSGEFYDLNTKLGIPADGDKDANWLNPAGPAFLRSGHYYNSSASLQGSYGNYWASTSSISSLAYNLNFNSVAVTPGGVGSRYYGYSVRCVQR